MVPITDSLSGVDIIDQVQNIVLWVFALLLLYIVLSYDASHPIASNCVLNCEFTYLRNGDDANQTSSISDVRVMQAKKRKQVMDLQKEKRTKKKTKINLKNEILLKSQLLCTLRNDVRIYNLDRKKLSLSFHMALVLPVLDIILQSAGRTSRTRVARALLKQAPL